MKYYSGTTDFASDSPSAVTLGKFDGMHRGHQKLFQRVRSQAGLNRTAFMIAPDEAPCLLTKEEKKKKLQEWDFDTVIDCPYIPEVLSMTPEIFIEKILVGRLKVRYIAVGSDFRFGRGRRGDASSLVRLQEKYGYHIDVIEKEKYNGREISSTYVKEAVQAGQMELAGSLLGFPYPVLGEVMHGRQLGRRLGMPTINLVPDQRKILPPSGVYFTRVRTGDGTFKGVTNVGYKPTVDGSFLGVETYLYDFNEDLYGKEAEVYFEHYRRPEQKFSDLEALKTQMFRDLAAGREFFA